jgi:hypothetical protein
LGTLCDSNNDGPGADSSKAGSGDKLNFSEGGAHLFNAGKIYLRSALINRCIFSGFFFFVSSM